MDHTTKERENERECQRERERERERCIIAYLGCVTHSVLRRYSKEWEITVKRIGRWIDFDSGYRTMDASFMESVWWVFKQLWDKGLVYKGYKVRGFCVGPDFWWHVKCVGGSQAAMRHGLGYKGYMVQSTCGGPVGPDCLGSGMLVVSVQAAVGRGPHEQGLAGARHMCRAGGQVSYRLFGRSVSCSCEQRALFKTAWSPNPEKVPKILRTGGALYATGCTRRPYRLVGNRRAYTRACTLKPQPGFHSSHPWALHR